MTETPDVRGYYLTHRAMIMSGDALHAALADIDDDDRRRAGAIERWFDSFAGELSCHHRIEDESVFPALAPRVPAFERIEARVESEHHRLDELISQLRAAFRSLARDAEWMATQLRAVTLAAELRDLLRSHLGFENDEIIPLFEQHLTVDEWARMETQARKMTPIRQLLFTVPWMLSSLEDRERDELMTSVPKPLQLMWFMTRRGYARRTQDAFGVSTRLAVG